MPEPAFHDLPILGELGAALDAAMAREAEAEQRAAAATPRVTAHSDGRLRRRFPNPFRTLGIALLFAGLGTSTAAATLTVLRGSPIPSPKAIDTQPLMRPTADSGTVLPLRAADPGGGEPFALRQSTSETGLQCATVGQIQGELFGIVGTDGLFRELPRAVVNGCGQATAAGPAVLGARVFDAPSRAEVRTVVYGLGGDALEAASAEVRGRTQALEVKDGAFLLALRDYPEDIGLRVDLRFAGGKRVDYPLGAGIALFVDPEGPAWRIQAFSTSGYTGNCVHAAAARPSRTTPSAPPVCGEIDLANKRSAAYVEDYFASIRTVRPGDRGDTPGQGPWSWKDAPARTLVTGYADPKLIRQVEVLGAGRPITPKRLPGGTFFVPLLPATAPARALRVRFTYADGRVRATTGPETNTITPRRSRKAVR